MGPHFNMGGWRVGWWSWTPFDTVVDCTAEVGRDQHVSPIYCGTGPHEGRRLCGLSTPFSLPSLPSLSPSLPHFFPSLPPLSPLSPSSLPLSHPSFPSLPHLSPLSLPSLPPLSPLSPHYLPPLSPAAEKRAAKRTGIAHTDDSQCSSPQQES